MPNDVRACRLMTPRRSPRGLTLIELLISTFIMSFAGAAVAGLLLLNNVTQVRVNNKIDNLNMARTAFERIGRDARMARNVGDITGTSVLLYAGPPEVYGTEGSSSFPASNNPLYNGGQSPPGG